MGILQPSTGLLFWMLVAFGVVFLVLARFGFPVIVRALAERKRLVDTSIEHAREIEQRVAGLDEECRIRKSEIEKEHRQIIQAAMEERKAIISKAEEAAEEKAQAIVDAARRKAEAERDLIIGQASEQIVEVSLAVAERIMRERLSGDEASELLASRITEELTCEMKH